MKRAYVAYKVATLTLFAALAWGCCATVGGNKVCVSPQQVVTATPTAVAPRPEPRVEPSSLPTDAPPTASPTKAPTAAPTALPTTPASSNWPTSLWFVNGFSGCNPVFDGNGQLIPGNRSECDLDRTAWYKQPGFDLIPKGTGCADEPNGPCRPSCSDPGCPAECNKCLGNDSAGTPCGHAPSCDDHIACYRNFIGCGCDVLGVDKCQSWDAVTPHPGSRLTFTGITCEDRGGYSAHCTGTPGAAYTLCTEPWPNAKTADGRAIPGGMKHCVSGLF